MSRVRRGFKARQRRNKILALAKGFHFDRRTKYRHAKHTVERALHYAYRSRRLLKRDMKRLWVTRISAASRALGSTYSHFIGQTRTKGVRLNRKMMAELAARDPKGFEGLYKSVQ